MMNLLLIGVCGGVGSVLRYLVTQFVQQRWGGGEISAGGFPLGTLTVNVTGCIAIGLLASALTGPGTREETRLAVLVGLLGGFTTFSSFGRETLVLLDSGRFGAAALYIALSNGAGLAGVWGGMRFHGK